MRFVSDDTATRQGMGKGSDFAHGAARGRLSGETRWRIPRASKMTAQQVDPVNEVIDGCPLRVLIHAHAPQAGDAQIAVRKQVRQHEDVLLRHAR